ncbi:MAG: TonB-dependent receptor [Bacteroidetes bacterium]|nr:TonB-dependent receptor [Bacteroidota bacterium]
MLRKFYVVLAFILASVSIAYAQSGGAIKGKVIDKATREGIPFAVVTVSSNGVNAGGTTTDMNGEFQIKPLNAGVYLVKVQYAGYQPLEVKGVIVSDLKTTYFDQTPLELNATSVQMTEAVIVDYKEPLIDPDTKSGSTVTREEFLAMPSKNINSVAATTAGVYQADEGKGLNMRGMRDGGTAYFIDGQRVIGSANLPQSAIEQVNVITGGVPAQFGDAAGGIVNITTRGPQAQYFGGVELITSEVLDKYGYNFVGFSVGGPILISTKDSNNIRPILGFILSGEGSIEKDPNPSAIGTYKVNDDTLRYLEENPLRPAPNGAGFVRNTEFTHMDDLQKIKARQNVESRTLRLNAKIDFKPTENLNLTFGGSVDYNNRHDYIYEYALFNPTNNPMVNENTWRVYGRLTQRFGSSGVEADKSASNIKNAYYTLQVGYTRYKKVTEDDTHKDKFFDYGHIGTFHQYKTRTFAPGNIIYNGDTTLGYIQTAYSDSALTFDPHYYDTYTGSYGSNGLDYTYDGQHDPLNPLETNYTSYVYDNLGGNVVNGDEVRANLGLLNGDRPGNVYSLWYNTGRQYPGYHITDNTQVRVSTSFSADIKNHAIQVGFEFEQRAERGYDLSAAGLWDRMRQLANAHLTQLDLANPHMYNYGTYNAYLYDRYYDASQQKYFDKSLRAKLGMPENSTDWIDIDALPPSFFTLDMFSADDMLLDGNNIVSYYGYDYTGKRSKGNPSFDDFFNQKDANGNFTRAVPAFRPIYMAGYIQDKFDFKDLKFNVGVRFDRFDANQKVLKDKYLFYEAKTVSEIKSEFPGTSIPDNMGDDYVVYGDATCNWNTIVGFRNGDTWYDGNGNEVADPSVIAQASQTGQISPILVNCNQTQIDSKAFKDYSPQINVMPRIAFAFPISEEANFFAHYDVLTQRPTDAYRLDPLEYYYIANRVALFNNNPDLKPMRTTDYELGFTQTLTARKNSAITLSAFYREMRNMIETVAVNYAYPAKYLTYGNIDFGTVKGFTVAYDLRRTGGVQLTASYTLQFADGSGSGAGSGANLVSAGQPNLRTTIPLDFDQRHSIVANVDYRFGSGANYHGPVWERKGGKTVKLFDNCGANMVFRAGSGTPYSKQSNVSPEAQFGVASRQILQGSINGSRLPWQIRVDLRIDKNIDLHWGGNENGEGQKMANLNVYLQVLNVLNTKNILGIYRYTGNPLDDGYLAAAETQSLINSQNDPTSFRDLYSVKVANPSNYSIPRRIRIGVMLDF